MGSVNLGSVTDFSRWHMIFLLLSMERIARFWPEMGLTIEATHALREIAQAFVREYRDIEANPSLSVDQRQTRYEQLIEKTFDQIIDKAGENIAQQIYEWGSLTFQFDMDTDAQAFVWRFLLRRLARVSGLPYPLIPLSLPEEKVEGVREAVITHLGNPSEIQNRLRAAERESASPWEEQIYRTYTSGASPMDWVENTIEFVRVRSAWREIEDALNEEELDRLRIWGEQQAKVMEMPPGLVGLPDIAHSE